MNDVTYPEHEKLKALNGANQTVGDFIEWLGMRGLFIANYPEREDGSKIEELFWCGKSRDELLAEFFEIDRHKLEAEKVSMLEKIREDNERERINQSH